MLTTQVHLQILFISRFKSPKLQPLHQFKVLNSLSLKDFKKLFVLIEMSSNTSMMEHIIFKEPKPTAHR